MSSDSFKALWVTETPEGSFERRIGEKPMSLLPHQEVLIRVAYSSLNYKDALSATGNRGVTRSYPHIPGVDAAGVVAESRSARFRRGDEVLVTGYELGSHAWGGWSEFIRVPADWVVPKPDNLSLFESMSFGTAGFTAGLGVLKLQHQGVTPDSGPIVVTGATGGVGCMAVAILAKLGYAVTAITGKAAEHDFLRSLGTKEILGREEIIDTTEKPLLSGRWAGVVDTVGGSMLESAIRQTKPEGTVTCCGNIGSGELHTSIYPFILRGVSLHGIGSAFTPMQTRTTIWNRLSHEWKPGQLGQLVTTATLEELNARHIETILRGGIRGRVVVTIGGNEKGAS